MLGPHPLRIPVSTVDNAWLEKDFFPNLKRSILALAFGSRILARVASVFDKFFSDLFTHGHNGGIVWVGVDSAVEGDYLVQKTLLFMESLGGSTRMVTVGSDPALFWPDVTAVSGENEAIWRYPPRSIVGILNGFEISPRELEERHAALQKLASSNQIFLIIPVSHKSGYCLSAGEIVTAPRFAEQSEFQRTTVCHSIITDSMPGLSSEHTSTVASQLISASPRSRAELAAWIDKIAEKYQGSGILPSLPSVLPSVPDQAKELASRHELRDRLNIGIDKLHKANVLFHAAVGEPLVPEIRPPLDPFESRDPISWFSGLVSYLSCYLFDPEHPCLRELQGLEWSSDSQSVDKKLGAMFVSELRSLRTMMQHGIKPLHPKDIETCNDVIRWSGRGLDIWMRRDFCRGYVLRLFGAFENFVNTMYDVLVNLGAARNGRNVMAGWEVVMRKIPKYRWDELIDEESRRLGLPLEVALVRDRHLADLQAKLAKTTLKSGELMGEARRLVQGVVISESAKCPVQTQDFLDAGYKSGPQLGKVKKYVEGLWGKDSSQTVEQLIERVKVEIPPLT